jgi:hypothetical protein
VLVEDYCNFSSQHDGPCCIGKPPIPLLQPKNLRLLLDKKGNPRGPDTACFGDAGAVKAFMKKQNEIMGMIADGESIYVPDLGHTIKNNNNNDTYKMREQDPSFKGTNCLTNPHIKSLQSDITKAVKWYHLNVGDPVARKDCLDQLMSIVPHHCGDHSLCKHERFCTYGVVKNESGCYDKSTRSQLKEHVASRVQ